MLSLPANSPLGIGSGSFDTTIIISPQHANGDKGQQVRLLLLELVYYMVCAAAVPSLLRTAL